MNRSIKFRIFDKGRNNFLHKIEEHWSIFFDEGKCWFLGGVEVNETSYVIQQFTGLTDQNNQEIYEGDIIQVNYTTIYEILDESGKFIKWSDDEKQFFKNYEVIWHSGDYEINASEYTIGLNGWAAKLIKDTKKSTLDQIGSVISLSVLPKEINYGFYGLVAAQTEIVGNIFEKYE